MTLFGRRTILYRTQTVAVLGGRHEYQFNYMMLFYRYTSWATQSENRTNVTHSINGIFPLRNERDTLESQHLKMMDCAISPSSHLFVRLVLLRLYINFGLL